MSDTPLVQMTDLPTFVVAWVAATSRLTPEQAAEHVWKLANAQYSAGFERGRDDPEFQNDAD